MLTAGSVVLTAGSVVLTELTELTAGSVVLTVLTVLTAASATRMIRSANKPVAAHDQAPIPP